ncbi:MAG: type II secretion system protein [Candidatus Pacebacteria bacterium]|nr:type II secretion system protein [Candidatus Paceibacterota bacterium]
MIKNKQKGFTLIELLVVIAIIGILSGTVIVSMSGTQETAKDSRIKSTLGQIRTAAEVAKFADPDVKYPADMWTTDQAIMTLLADLKSNGKDTADPVKIVNVGRTAWCVSQSLNITTGGATHCVDSTGYNKYGSCIIAEGGTQGTCAAL